MPRLVDIYPYRYTQSGYHFLVLKRAQSQQYAGQWRMVAGKVEEGETAWQAALRELDEETCCRPLEFWCLPSLNYFYNIQRDKVELIPAFAAGLKAEDTVILNKEHSEYKWIEISELANFIHWPEQRRLMKLIHTILINEELLEDWKISF